ncbi:Uncharacterized protein involved in exopolysaccharide biosynthesis [Aliiroseovarius halocynthiae]|uniref:Lipopolysaccharide biosynthesis protein n=1 Tax=Aliiroseovarius halocynthiae TaxID=985055 RepID=A0A545SWN3_9RHOB|nr:hypothetical protein [Aliiroseovarius halocynthiae]TQV69377.1 hypothetical protein FIL88_07465 [Aliiroseovarius halocynthiae]SMR72723.1 Uncharacterized protein involved in exopolysaccharide biosynthesis [Aliiroseovarius halocynthiae]
MMNSTERARVLPRPLFNWRIDFKRIFLGGSLGDLGRLPRYTAFALLGLTLIWAPITGYLKTTPLVFKSTVSLILPGSGASASMNLNGIGQATSYANSAFASNSVSPTETYKRLIGADRILNAAAISIGETRRDFGRPRISLVDQTGLIHLEMTGGSPEQSQARAEALLEAFFVELDALRSDELSTREDGGRGAINDYRSSIAQTRDKIEALQASSGLFSVDQYDVLLDNASALEVDLTVLAGTLSDRTQSVRALEVALGLNAALAAASLKAFADPDYVALCKERSVQAALLAELTSRFGPQHPRAQSTQRAYDAVSLAAKARAEEITGMGGQALRALDFAQNGARADLLARLVRLEAERAGVQQKYDTLSAELAGQHAELTRLADSAARLQDLQRDFSVAEAIFASAIARAQSGKSDPYASYPLVQVLENPSRPEKPSSPNRKLALAAGVAASLFLFFGLMLGWVRQALISRLLQGPKARA